MRMVVIAVSFLAAVLGAAVAEAAFRDDRPVLAKGLVEGLAGAGAAASVTAAP